MRVVLFFTFGLPIFCVAQTDTFLQKAISFYTEKRTDMTLGYNFYFGKRDEGDTTTRKFHFVEIGIWRTRFYFHRHWGGFGCYAMSEIGLNTKKWVIAPKIGGFMAIGPIILGNDFSIYTDFSEGSLHWIPYFGIGTNRFKLTINPHVVLSNKDFLEKRLPAGHVHFSYAMLNLHRKRTN
ncbi:MAG: hypothetical protein DYG98_05625 [Haliscomenobacteraceae bacterium CHB4]|nr:hypothetical protein [Saprospiraceae bacterium]MCE7922512.1 hypothetical protein [Haliscomenobacteraceae bacterium CHB4]